MRTSLMENVIKNQSNRIELLEKENRKLKEELQALRHRVTYIKDEIFCEELPRREG